MSNLSFLLKILYKSAQDNCKKKKKGHRYSEDIFLFASYVYLTAGLMFYENIQAMLGDALPHVSNVKKYVSKTQVPVKEGVLRCKELKEYLTSRHLPLKVWLSEDGTRIVSKLMYDKNTNQIVGPVLPLSESTGMPLIESYPATSAALIAKHVMHGVPASLAYVVMAQPLSTSTPPFCLQIFGTVNRYNAEDVSRRWETTKIELAKEGVEVLGISTDGDTKALKSMRAALFTLKPACPPALREWFCGDVTDPVTPIQDTIHLLNRFKTRLIKPSIVLPLGKFVASSSHLHIMINNVSKTEHGMSDYDLTKTDKMNFDATMKMCSKRVVDTLKLHGSSVNGTVVYLDLMKKMECAFLNPELTPLERIYNMWYIVFFLRIWKMWILSSRTYTLDSNFITQNMYIGSEINAHGIVKVIRVLRDSKCDKLFLPLLMSSQPCESFFRKARSLTTTESTVINFSMLEFLHKIRRIEFLMDFRCKMEGKLVFAKDRRITLLDHGEPGLQPLATEPLPLDYEIREILLQALSDSTKTANELGMQTACPSIVSVSSSLRAQLDLSDDFYDQAEEPLVSSNDFNEDDDDIPLDILQMFPLDFSFDLTSNDNESFDGPVPPDSKLVQLLGAKGDIITMPKTTLLWILRTEGPKVSIDRGMRVRAELQKCTQKDRKCVESVCTNETICIGDFCVFKLPKINLRLGQVLGFKYLSGDNTSYSLDSVPTTPPVTGARGIGVLCSWFIVNNNGLVTPSLSQKHSYVDIKGYRHTVPCPTKKDGMCFVSDDCLKILCK